MKKLFTIMMLVMVTITTWAYDVEMNGIYYNLNSTANTATVTSGTKEYSGAVTIPESFVSDGVTYSVTSIGGFAGCYGLTSVTIPNSVTSIGDDAFYGCLGLTSVTIPNSVTSIGDEAFSGCFGLNTISVESGNTVYDSRDNCNAIIETSSKTLIAGCKNTVIPNSVTSIGSYAFYYCSGLTSVTIPNSVTSIGAYAFYKCSGLTSVTIGNSVTSIGESAFEDCSSLSKVDISDITSWMKISFNNEKSNPLYYAKHLFLNGEEVRDLVVPNTITSIRDWSFYNCLSLNSVTINEAVTSIGDRAFRDCTGLTSVTIPNSVTSIGEYAFLGCTGLSSVTISNSVTTIEDYTFYGCSGLTSVTIPNSVTSIGMGAFELCSGLTSVTIPNSVTSIGGSAFQSCKGLTSVTIPNSVTSIGSFAFYGCSGLTSVTIPNSVTSIGWLAFESCSGLNTISVESGNTVYDSRDNCNAIIETSSNTLIAGCKNTVIPNSVTSIGSWAFRDCTGLTSVTIPNSVTSIGDGAFYKCSGLTSVTIGNSVTSIGDDAFYDCKSLQSIYSENTTPPTLSSSYDFYNVGKSIPVYVPAESVQAYKAAEYWSEFTNIQGIKSTSTLALTDAEPTIVAGTYEAGNVTYTRTTTAGNYATFCLPYDVAMDDVSDVFSAVYTVAPWCVRNPSTGLLQLMLNKKRSGTIISAGTPFIACAKTTGNTVISNYESVTFEETTANPEPTSLVVYDNNGGSVLMENTDLVVKAGGTYTKMTGLDREKYRVFDTSASFGKSQSVNTFRAYIYKDDSASSAKISQITLNFLDDDNVTGINSITGSSATSQPNGYYNLNGQRINFNAGQKGIFIINGKKFINK